MSFRWRPKRSYPRKECPLRLTPGCRLQSLRSFRPTLARSRHLLRSKSANAAPVRRVRQPETLCAMPQRPRPSCCVTPERSSSPQLSSVPAPRPVIPASTARSGRIHIRHGFFVVAVFRRCAPRSPKVRGVRGRDSGPFPAHRGGVLFVVLKIAVRGVTSDQRFPPHPPL